MMTENFEHKIRRLELENFTCFTKAEMDFSSGINVFIGENGTGKTHVLKVLYSMNYAAARVEITANSNEKDSSNLKFNPYSYISDMALTFGTNIWIELIRDINQPNTFFKTTFSDELEFGLRFSKGELSHLTFTLSDVSINSPIYIPPYEMLSNSILNNNKIYFDLVNALNIKKGEPDLEILDELNELIKIKVEKRDDVFYISIGNEKNIKANLNANGLNKIGQLIPLIQNGSLNKNTILFWDEPETNLNPKYIKIVAQFLQTLAKNGVQIFVATHDYLLTYWLSLAAEYPHQDTPPMRFFSLSKGEDGTEIEAADTMNGLKNNVLLDEYSAYSDAVLAKSFDSLNEPV